MLFCKRSSIPNLDFKSKQAIKIIQEVVQEIKDENVKSWFKHLYSKMKYWLTTVSLF